MNAKLTGLYVSAQQRIARMSDDKGQGALEYIGILAIIVLVLGIVFAAFESQDGAISGRVSELVTQLMSGGQD